MPKVSPANPPKPTPYSRSTSHAATDTAAPEDVQNLPDFESIMQQFEEAKKYRFHFGRHKEQTIEEVPWDYVQHLIEEGFPNNSYKLRNGIEDFLQRNPVFRGPDGKSIEQRHAEIRDALPEWLYEECVAVLERYKLDEEVKASALENMVISKYDKKYPARPEAEERLPDDSPAVIELRACLSKCPGIKSGKWAANNTRVQRRQDMFSGDSWWDISWRYEDEITKCLAGIEAQLGKEAKALANWEVRDMIAQRVKGITLFRLAEGSVVVTDASIKWLR